MRLCVVTVHKHFHPQGTTLTVFHSAVDPDSSRHVTQGVLGSTSVTVSQYSLLPCFESWIRGNFSGRPAIRWDHGTIGKGSRQAGTWKAGNVLKDARGTSFNHDPTLPLPQGLEGKILMPSPQSLLTTRFSGRLVACIITPWLDHYLKTHEVVRP